MQSPALCNSSVLAAQSATEAYNLPATTKANGNPQDLAEDDPNARHDGRGTEVF